MTTDKILVNNKSGLHARPATDFVELAKAFEADIKVSFNGKTKNAKSVIGILSLGIHKGAEIEVTCEGADEEKALQAIKDLAAVNFNEAE